MATNVWSMVAITLAGQSGINALVEFNGKIYGGTKGAAKLFEWNGSDAWIDRATLIGTADIYCLVVYNNQLYGGAADGKLVRWNGINAWVLVHDIGVPGIFSFAKLGGNLYFSTGQNSAIGGRLYRWTGAGAPVMVADQLDGQKWVLSLINYKGNIYGGTSPNGRLFKWNGANNWVEVAAQHAVMTMVHALAEYEGKLFGSVKGMLFEWNGSNAWITRAPMFLAQNDNYSLGVYHENKLQTGTSNLANLFMWNGVDAWLQVAPQVDFQTEIHALIEFEGEFYAGSYKDAITGGRLYKWIPANPGPPTDLLCCDKSSSGVGATCDPALISSLTPYFSAIYNDPDVGDIADHYRIQVSSDPDMGGTMLWDSGKTPMANVLEGERCEDITYNGTFLGGEVTYYWRIMFWDDEGHIGDWSEINCFRPEQKVFGGYIG